MNNEAGPVFERRATWGELATSLLISAVTVCLAVSMAVILFTAITTAGDNVYLYVGSVLPLAVLVIAIGVFIPHGQRSLNLAKCIHLRMPIMRCDEVGVHFPVSRPDAPISWASIDRVEIKTDMRTDSVFSRIASAECVFIHIKNSNGEAEPVHIAVKDLKGMRDELVNIMGHYMNRKIMQ